MKEAALVKKIIATVKEKCPKAYIRKLSDRFSRGLPDIIIVAPPKEWIFAPQAMSFFLAVEAKNPSGKGRTSKLQELEGAQINALPGAKWLVAESVEAVIEELERAGCC